ncbi:hypothetical protein [Chondrinema litorale]|uniref:hypothetical protein n=1 Tax=Chondrinema litorale TaxID=2994555 RepID=UPI0025431725|nr:hypothetical protein [Chondrinema litorale]UZR99814.1 hypothetical protein OQ292_38580 [Chondrinema litorale]
MKRLISIVTVLIFLFSCEGRWEEAIKDSDPPVLAFYKNGSTTDSLGNAYEVITDSLKLGIKSNAKEYTFSFQVVGANLKSINYQSDKGTFIENLEEVKSDSIYTVTYVPDEIYGLHIVDVFASNSFGKQQKITLELFIYENLPPVADFEVIEKGVIRTLHYQVDASSSLDLDAQYGGYITEYLFTIDGIEIQRNKSVVDFIFQELGQYEIKLKVKDNDDAWSEEKSIKITL